MNALRMPTGAMVVWLAALILAALAVFPHSSFGADGLVPVPRLEVRVTDLTGTLTAEQKAGLEQRLLAFETRKGTQISVLMVATTKPEAIEQYALRVVEQWKLGRKKVDDGALLLVAKDDRTIRIEVGYGLEGALNDAVAKRIISEVITPPFKNGDFFAGISAGVDQMIRVIDGEPLPPTEQIGTAAVGPNVGQLLPFMFVLALFVGGGLRSALGRVPGAVVAGGVIGLLGWMFAGAAAAALLAGGIAFLVTLLGIGVGGHRGMHGGGLYGGYGGRGGGRGGFSGGGGGFGGGGASGRF
jgi:uncharacterized protein